MSYELIALILFVVITLWLTFRRDRQIYNDFKDIIENAEHNSSDPQA